MSRLRFSRLLSILLLIFSALIFSSPAIQAQADYSTIEQQLKAGEEPDTRALRNLPEPETAEQFSIRAQLQRDWADARLDWRRAVDRSNSDTDWETNFLGWLKLGLLRKGDTEDLRWMRETLSRRAQNKPVSDEIWYHAGQVETLHGHMNRALQFFEKISEQSDRFTESLLLRVKYELDRNNIDRARELLERVFMQTRKDVHPRYWLLKGEFYEKVGSDSEAYIAYSHLINYYPDYYNRSTAESRIANLSLPRALYPDRGPDRRSEKQERVTDQSGREDTEQQTGEFQVQAGSFRERSRARTVRQNLEASIRFPVKITRAMVDGNRYYRVRIHNIPSRDRASRVINDLHSLGYEGYVVNP